MKNKIYALNNKKGTHPHGAFIEFLVCALLSSGIIGVLSVFSGSAVYSLIIVAEAVIICAVNVLFRKKSYVTAVFNCIVIAVCTIAVLLNFAAVQTEILRTINTAIDYINQTFIKDIALFRISNVSVSGTIILYMIISAGVSVFICFLVKKRTSVILVCTSLIFVILTVTLKLPNEGLLIFILIMGMLSCWSYTAGGNTYNVIYVCLGVSAVFFISFGLLSAAGFDGFSSVTHMQNMIKESVYTARFGEDSLPHGKLDKAASMLKNDDETLVVQMSEPQKMYLKGFVGGYFDGNEWNEQKQHSMSGEWNGIIPWLKSRNFSPVEEYSQYLSFNSDTIDSIDVEVTNSGADRKYIYMPFAVYNVGGASAYNNKDLQTMSDNLFGAKKYSFKALKLDNELELLEPSYWETDFAEADKTEYMKSENVYRAYVEDTYLDIDEKTKSEINRLFFEDFDFSEDSAGLYTVTSRIRLILKLRAQYEMFPEAPNDGDFAEWFLEKYRKGNSVYFATAAVLAYRAAGIPARYAEGYYISDLDAENMKQRGVNTIRLSQRNSHSWVEVYRDGVGWISVDVTPGFYTETADMQDTVIFQNMTDGYKQYNAEDNRYYPDNSSKFSPQGVEKTNNWAMRFLILILIVLIISLIILYIRYIILTSIRLKNVYGKANKNSSLRILNYIIKMLYIDGIHINIDSPYDNENVFLNRHPVFIGYEYERIMSIMQQIQFGNADVCENEVRTIQLFYQKLSREVYKNQRVIKKLLITYIYCLY